MLDSAEQVATLRLGHSMGISLANGQRYVLAQSMSDERRGFTVLRMPSSSDGSGRRPSAVGHVSLRGSSLFKTSFDITLKPSAGQTAPDMLPALVMFLVNAALDSRAAERVVVATAPQIALTAAVGASVC